MSSRLLFVGSSSTQLHGHWYRRKIEKKSKLKVSIQLWWRAWRGRSLRFGEYLDVFSLFFRLLHARNRAFTLRRPPFSPLLPRSPRRISPEVFWTQTASYLVPDLSDERWKSQINKVPPWAIGWEHKNRSFRLHFIHGFFEAASGQWRSPVSSPVAFKRLVSSPPDRHTSHTTVRPRRRSHLPPKRFTMASTMASAMPATATQVRGRPRLPAWSPRADGGV